MKPWLLKFHRWLALAFSLPLAIVIVTGLILSFEPWLVARSIEPGRLTAEKIESILAKHDPNGQARGLSYRAYDGSLTVGGGRGGGTIVDAASGEVKPAPSSIAKLLGTSRGLHERLLIDAGWLVVASTSAMLALIMIGVLMGWPRFANTVSGWHKAMAWGLLPLLVLSPLTGLFLSAGITFTGPQTAAARQGQPPGLVQALKVVAREHDLSGLVWIRPQGGRLLARLAEGGEYRVYAVTADAATVTSRNWPRLWHEGNFAGAWSAAMNVVVSLAMAGLLVTGVWIWLRRKLRRRQPRVMRPA